MPCEWEPRYPVATYDDDGVHCDPPVLDQNTFHLSSREIWGGDFQIEDDDTETAVRELFSSWTTESNGKVRITVADGSIHEALFAHRIPDAPIAPISTELAFSWLAWAGASGGAHGTRRGMATGRFGVWWLCATIADIADEWPLDSPEAQDAIRNLQWSRFIHDDIDTNGWVVHLAVHDPSTGLSVVIDAGDSVNSPST